MDRISDSGSDGCGSIPHGGTKKGLRPLSLYPVHPSHFVTAPVGHADLSLSLRSGAVAGSMFFKHLPDASGTALKRLSLYPVSLYLRGLFAPLIQPAEVFSVPQKGILRLQDPMVLVREDEKS